MIDHEIASYSIYFERGSFRYSDWYLYLKDGDSREDISFDELTLFMGCMNLGEDCEWMLSIKAIGINDDGSAHFHFENGEVRQIEEYQGVRNSLLSLVNLLCIGFIKMMPYDDSSYGIIRNWLVRFDRSINLDNLGI
jgi:hypothetical protein